jgi:alpha-L-fucosidase
VRLYHDAGARFLVVQGVHHDNVDNWRSRYQPWNTANLGPRRDLPREWTDAARAAGTRYGVAFHHEYTWWWYRTAFGSDATGPRAGVPCDGHLTLADGRGTWWEGYDPRLLYTVDLREYRGLDVEFAPARGTFTGHQAYARWYATWWLKADAMERVAAHYFNRTLARRGRHVRDPDVQPPRGGVVGAQEGTLLGHRGPLAWRHEADALVIRCPAAMPFQVAVGFRVR